MPTRNPPTSPITLMKAKFFMVGWRLGEMIFNSSLKQKQRGDDHQQQSYRGLDEIVDARAVAFAQVHQESDAQVRAGNAADRQRQDDFPPHRAFEQCMMLAGILVKKLNRASLPTAMMAGMCRPKMSMGSSNTPPPKPVNPISVPTMKPIRTFQQQEFHAVFRSEFPVPSSPFSVKPKAH